MINRLKSLKDFRDMNQPAVKDFPKPKIRSKNNGKSNGGNKNKKDNNLDGSISATPESSNKASQSSVRKGGLLGEFKPRNIPEIWSGISGFFS